MNKRVGMKELILHLDMCRESIMTAIATGMPAKQFVPRGKWWFSLEAVDAWFATPHESRQQKPGLPAVTKGEKVRAKKRKRDEIDLAACHTSGI